MELDPLSVGELNDLSERIAGWLDVHRSENSAVASVERDETGERRWFVRLNGEEKSVFTVWLHLRQRSLHAETYLMPFPAENQAECFEYLLRRSAGLIEYRVCIGDEDAVYLRAEIPGAWVDDGAIDRLLGGAYVYTEQLFRPAMRIGFASRFGG